MDRALASTDPHHSSPVRWGPILRALFRRFFGPVHFPEEAARELEALARRGTIVYVMRSAGILNFLYFNWAFAQRGLPLARAAVGLSTRLYRHVAGLVSRRPDGRRAVLEAVERGESAMVFLRRPAALRSQGEQTDDPFPDLIALQRRSKTPIFVVPQLLVMKRAPVKMRPGVADVVLGSAEVPGRLHAFVSFLFNHKRAFVKFGKPLALAEVIAQEPEAPDAVLARKVRGSLAVGLGRELRVVVGPPLKEPERLEDEILRDRVLRDELQTLAASTGTPEAELERQVRRCLREIGARYSPAFIDGATTLAGWVFHRIFDGVHVDEDGLRAAAEAAKRAPLVICPTHRSHVDYLLVSYVLFERGMTPPVIAAGANLSFWPLGAIFRRGGAFFIRRSFKGDRVYGAALSAYIRKLAHDGYTQEFYPEGGRTRTGRILQPKFGLIGMEVDAWIAGARDDLHFVPVAIDYEKLIEAGSYARELAGGEKRKEDLAGLLKVPAVLGSRWGRVYVQLEQPISLAAFARSRGFDPADHTADQKRDLVRALGHRIANAMGHAQTIGARALVSAALLAHRSRGTAAQELAERVELLRSLAEEGRSRFSPGLRQAPASPLAPGPIREALLDLAQDEHVKVREAAGETIYQVRDEARPQIAFYKNNVVHHFQDASILAGALLSFGGAKLDETELLARVEQVSRVLKLELSFRGGVPLRTVVEETARTLESRGLLRRGESGLEVTEAGRSTLAFLRELLADVVESYHLAIGSLEALDAPGAALEKKELIRRALERGRALYLAGRVFAAEAISRPTLENAVAWLEEQGHLVPDGRKLRLSPGFRGVEARAGVLRALDAFLQR